jgi:hypothetical protein
LQRDIKVSSQLVESALVDLKDEVFAVFKDEIEAADRLADPSSHRPRRQPLRSILLQERHGCVERHGNQLLFAVITASGSTANP